MIGQQLLSERKLQLLNALKAGLKSSRTHTTAFAFRVLPQIYQEELFDSGAIELSPPLNPTYGGYPDVAFLGFSLAANPTDEDLAKNFLEGYERLKKRDNAANRPFFLDDVALLGVADGLAALPHVNHERSWLLTGIEQHSGQQQWSSRMRDLACDLLDRRGRLRVAINSNDINTLTLELILRSIWANPFRQTALFSDETNLDLLKQLLSDTLPSVEDVEQITAWLGALEYFIDIGSRALLPSISDTSRILRSVEHSFKRWFWEEKPRQGLDIPAQWLIDNEYHVQAILWAVLYPIYGLELIDETYLPNWGQTQPRADLSISKLKLIIEVKYLREPSDFQKFEGEIGNDLGLYFKDPSLFDRMIVFIYDDCDNHHPQKYDGLRNALLKRERIEDVIIIRRPGMLPPRSARRPSRTRTRSQNSST